jgi:hypothetical protein
VNRIEPSREELRRLISGMCDNALSDAEFEQLKLQLSTDREALAYYVHYLGLHTSLAWTISAHPVAQQQALAAPVEQPRPWRRILKMVQRPKPFSMAMATLIMGLIITAMAIMAPPFYRALTVREPSDASENQVAYVTDLRQARWSTRQVPLQRHSQLQKGQRVELQSGFVVIQFGGGAKVALEGPCVFQPTDLMEGKLTAGKLSAQVPQRAIGFTVSTPTARIIDRGTEFGVKVAENKTEVVVLSGNVDVEAVSPSGSRGDVVRLTVGKTALVDGRRVVSSSVSEKTTRFVRCAEVGRSVGMQLIAHFRMGEDDAVEGDGVIAAASGVDSTHPDRRAVRSGAPRYISAVAAPGSSRAVAFGGGKGEHYAVPQCVTKKTDNFCISVWARAEDPARDGAIVWNGDIGWGILQHGENFCAHLNGVGDFGEHKLQAGRWYHLVLVRESGFAAFYVDGKLTGVNQQAPATPHGRFWIGATNDAFPFHGEIDEVRVYLLAPGRFQIGDILDDEG